MSASSTCHAAGREPRPEHLDVTHAGDVIDAMRWVTRIGADVRQLWTRTARLVTQRWRQIEVLAGVLLVEPKLSAHDVRQLAA